MRKYKSLSIPNFHNVASCFVFKVCKEISFEKLSQLSKGFILFRKLEIVPQGINYVQHFLIYFIWISKPLWITFQKPRQSCPHINTVFNQVNVWFLATPVVVGVQPLLLFFHFLDRHIEKERQVDKPVIVTSFCSSQLLEESCG